MIKTVLFLGLALAFRQVPAVPVDQIVAEHPSGFVASESPGSRIVSGWEAQPGQHPHQVSLRLFRTSGSVAGCGGSVVHREWILSAAHCTANIMNVIVLAGVTHVSRPDVTLETREMYNYPTYDASRPDDAQPNDISLIKLQEPLNYTNTLRPIRIQPSSDAFRDYNGVVLYASGFGRTWTEGATSESLLWVFLRGVSNPSCTQLFGAALINDNSICATFYNVTSQSICQGDSGGPLVNVEDDGTPTLVGVSSFVAGGIYGCHSGIPGGFIRPGPFHSWFTQITGIDFNNLVEEEEEEVEEPTTTAFPETTAIFNVTTPEPETTAIFNVTTPEPETTAIFNVTTPEPETTAIFNVTTPEPETTAIFNVTTPEPETTAIFNVTTAEPETTAIFNVTTAEPETTIYITTAEPETTVVTTTFAPNTTTPVTPEEEEDSEEIDDPEIADLLKRLEVKVKVKVKLSKYLKRKIRN